MTTCKCGNEMKFIARESDYGDTTAVLHWCPKCGRVCDTQYDATEDHGDAKEVWHEPESAVKEVEQRVAAAFDEGFDSACIARGW